MDRLKMQSADGVQDNIQKIAALFPNCVTETVVGYHDDGSSIVKRKVDFEKLQQELSDDVISGREERYQFTWPDKRKAILAANAPINATLRPCREESVDFDTTQNLYIEGDNLDVLKCLKETYLHRVKMIYIDPPYNTGNDFVYEDDFAESASDYLANSGQFDEQGNRMVTNAESNGRFHTKWLNMIYPRLKVARDLLSEDGVIFISIGVEEFATLKHICNEVFGESNFIEVFSWVKTSTPPSLAIKSRKTNEYILCYEKNKNGIKYNGELLDGGDQPLLNSGNKKTTLLFPADKTYFKVDKFPNGIYEPYCKEKVRLEEKIEIVNGYATGDFHLTGEFKWTQQFLDNEVANGTTFIIKGDALSVRFIRSGEGYKRPTNFIKEKYTTPIIDKPSVGVGTNENASSYLTSLMDGMVVFSYPKPVSLIKYLINFICKKDDIVIDFFSGSGTTLDSVFRYNIEAKCSVRCILVQLRENLDENLKTADPTTKGIIENGIKFLDRIGKPHFITELAKERIRRAGKKIKSDSPLTTQDLDTGFRVLKLDSTNMEDIYYSPKDTDQLSLCDMVDNVKQDRTSEDLLFQVMLELGATLDSKIEVIRNEKLGMRNDGKGYTIYNVADGYLVACFDQDVTDEVVTAIAKMQPTYAVLRDTSMATDATATNFEQIFKTYAPDTVTKTL